MVTFGRVFRSLDCALRRRMDQALSGMDLTFSQGHIMGYLAHCDTPPCAKDIEDRFHLSHPTVSGLLSRLEKKEFIALREDPDVILVGEMRDYETISAALTAAETGHLVLSTLHTIGAASTIDRIIDVFPAEGQHQVRAQLSAALQGVVTQQLIPTLDGTGRIAALEILTGNDAVRNLIRENKGHQIASLMQTGSKEGMRTLTQELARRTLEGRIAAESAYAVCPSPDDLRQYLEAGVPGRF